MARNYLVIHYIQEQLKDFKPEFVNCVIRSFNLIEKIKEPDGCLSNTAALYVCAKKYGYEPHICYGLCVFEGREFYHAWLEVNNTVIDIAIYGNVNYSPLSMWDFEIPLPCIDTYEKAFISYGRFKFDDEWNLSQISKVEGISLEKYIESAPNHGMWRLICKIMDVSLNKDIVEKLRPLVEGITISKG